MVFFVQAARIIHRYELLYVFHIVAHTTMTEQGFKKPHTSWFRYGFSQNTHDVTA
jgi:hypothetical protein